jgi:hypothetical protein
MSCSICNLPLGIKRCNDGITKHLNEGFILLTKDDTFHLNHKCHPDNDMVKEILKYIPVKTVWKVNKNIKIEAKCPVLLDDFEANPDLQIVIPPCNHPCSLEVFHNLITTKKPCPICRDKNFTGNNKKLITFDVKRNQTQANHFDAPVMERFSSCGIARSASLAPYIEYDETFSNLGHYPNLPNRTDLSTHMKLRKDYLNGKSIIDVNEVDEYSCVKLPIYALTLTQKATSNGFNDLFVSVLEKNDYGNYQLINSGSYNDSVVSFSNLNLTYKSLTLSHSSDPSSTYSPNFGGYLAGPNGEEILDHRVLISGENDNITDVKIHNLDISYTGSETLSSNLGHFNAVKKEFTKVANELELNESSNIVILLSQITYNSQTLRQLSTPVVANHQVIQPSCSVLSTTITDDKEIKIAPWVNDNSYMNTYLAIELIMKN